MTELLGRFLGLQSRPPVPWTCVGMRTGRDTGESGPAGGGDGCRPAATQPVSLANCRAAASTGAPATGRRVCPLPSGSPPPTRQSAGGGHPGSSRRSAKAVAKHVTAHLGADAREAGLLSAPAARRSEPGRARADSHRRQARLLGALKLGLRGTPSGPRVPAVPHVA